MTTSTPHVDRTEASRPALRPAQSRAGVRAFTLTEVILAATLSSFILAGILSTFLLIGRTGLNSAAYAEMNGKLRVALDRFNGDVHRATDLRWTDARRITLLLPADAGPSVTYAFEPARDAASPGRFVRQVSGAPAETLVASVSPDFAFARYRLPVSALDEPPAATNDYETKQLEVRLRAIRPGARAPAATQLAISARSVLRNKSIGQ